MQKFRYFWDSAYPYSIPQVTAIFLKYFVSCIFRENPKNIKTFKIISHLKKNECWQEGGRRWAGVPAGGEPVSAPAAPGYIAIFKIGHIAADQVYF